MEEELTDRLQDRRVEGSDKVLEIQDSFIPQQSRLFRFASGTTLRPFFGLRCTILWNKTFLSQGLLAKGYPYILKGSSVVHSDSSTQCHLLAAPCYLSLVSYSSTSTTVKLLLLRSTSFPSTSLS
jgi:hypothetical protein